MMDAAAPAPGRRAGAGAVLGLLGFLVLAPPAFVLGPLAALLALARPATWRERIWLGLAVALTALWLAAPGELPHQVTRAAAMGLAGATLAVAVSGREATGLRTAVTATVAACLGTVLWAALLGVEFETYRGAVETDLRTGYDALMGQGTTPEARDMARTIQDAAGGMAAVYPGVLAVLAATGVMLAWAWAHRIAERPVGRPVGRFRGFRFNDHLVWGAIFTLALALLPLGTGPAIVVANLLVVWVALYLARGLAVAVSFLAGAPTLLRGAAILFGLLLQPFSSGALLAVGLADTWLDFRRRPPAAPGGRDT